jgi:multisubunit Na+/H+ antiporter MnhC subunit
MIELALSSWMITFIHICILIVFVFGLLCFFLRKRYIRQLVGLKLMLQSISLGLILTGWEKGNLQLSQSMVISALVIEAVVISLALTMIIRMARHAQNEQDTLQNVSANEIRTDD